MTVQEIGAWVLLVVGALAFLAAIVKVFFQPPRSPLPWIFGLLAMGLSIWGLAFFEPYTSFLKVLTITEQPGQESYATFMESVGQGDVCRGYGRRRSECGGDSFRSGGGEDTPAGAGYAREPRSNRGGSHAGKRAGS